MKNKIQMLKQILLDLRSEAKETQAVKDAFIKGENLLTDLEEAFDTVVLQPTESKAKQLYATVKDNIDSDTWILGPARDGGLSAVMEWIAAELEDMSDEDAVDTDYTVGFQMMSEEEVNALPEP